MENCVYEPDFDIDIDYDIEIKKELLDEEIQHSLFWKKCMAEEEKSSLGYRAELVDANLNSCIERRGNENFQRDCAINYPVQIDHLKKVIKLESDETANEIVSNADSCFDGETICSHAGKNEATIIIKYDNVSQNNNQLNEEIELETEEAQKEAASDPDFCLDELEDDVDSSDVDYVLPSRKQKKQKGKPKRLKRNDKPKSVNCTVCEYSCPDDSRLLRHMRTHTKEKNYLCTLCDFKCYQSADLRLHLRSHTGEKLFNCEFCDYSATMNKSLMRHLKIHSGVKRHACSICDYSTIEAADLRAHMYKHKGIKPFSCESCNFRAAKSSDLVKHVRIHTGEKPYKCKVCDYRATRAYHLKIHLKRHAARTPKIKKK